MIEITATSVPDFMRSLLVTEPHFPSKNCYFRGQADSRWGLVPSGRRKKSWDRLGGAEYHALECDGGYVVSPDAELSLVESSLRKTLAIVGERMGLPVHLCQDGDELMAFAQHIGLPTRLLDWTRSPWTAAYFAAADAVRHVDENGKIAVFSVSRDFLQNSYRATDVRELEVSAAGNPNMVAQQGVLLQFLGNRIDLLEGLATHARPVGYRPTGGEGRSLENQLVKITLAWDMTAHLLHTLRNQEVHAATIYPGAAGVAGLVREVFVTERAMMTRP